MQPIFLDIEASGLSPGSWPIEVGLAKVTDAGIEVWSSLIRPDPSWSMDDWSEKSQRIHNIPRSDLDQAPEAASVVREVLERFHAATACSDAPEYDGRWLQVLFDTAGDTAPRLNDFHQLLNTEFSGLALDRTYEWLSRTPLPHRAGPDAERLALAYQNGLEFS